MSLEEVITSEVNFGLKLQCQNDDDFVQSDFKFSLEKSATNAANVRFDDDGDLIRDDDREFFVVIKHKVQSDLDNVGTQVWRGALFLADFALENWQKTFQKRNILEIGSGTGLTSIVVAKHCQPSNVTATDLPKFMQLLKDNVSLNKAQVETKVLDLLDMSNSTVENLLDFDVILGADVIYDNDLTDGICHFMDFMLKKKPDISFYFSIDKRYIFTLSDLDTVAPSYEYFMSKLQDLQSNVSVKEIHVQDVKQYFCYEQSQDLCIVSIKSG